MSRVSDERLNSLIGRGERWAKTGTVSGPAGGAILSLRDLAIDLRDARAQLTEADRALLDCYDVLDDGQISAVQHHARVIGDARDRHALR